MITQTNQREMDLSFSIPLIQTIIFSSCIAFLPNVVNLLFVMASLPYFYRKKLPYFITFIAFQFLHLFIDQTGTYLLIIYFVGYISFSAFVRLCRGNLKISMNLFQLVSCILFSIHPTQQITILVVMVIVQVILMGEEDETMALVTLFLGASGILLYYLMPTNQEIYLILSCFVICLMSNVKLSCMIFFYIFYFLDYHQYYL